MSIAVIYDNKDPKPWVDALSKHLPVEKIEIYPNIEEYSKVEFVLAWKAKKDDFLKFPNLKAIQSLGASVDHIFSIFEVPENVQVARIVDFRLADDMWEFVLSIILKEMKNISQFRVDQTNKLWRPTKYKHITEISVGILGAGEIGMHVAKKLAAIGFNVSVWSRNRKFEDGIASYCGSEELEIFLSKLDYLVDILPFTKATYHLIDYNFLKKLKKNAFLINVGRGEQVVDEDLIKCLDEGHIKGALLDVFHIEPLPVSHPYWKHPKVQITPHIASITNIESSILQISENFNRMKTGKPLLNLANQKTSF